MKRTEYRTKQVLQQFFFQENNNLILTVSNKEILDTLKQLCAHFHFKNVEE